MATSSVSRVERMDSVPRSSPGSNQRAFDYDTDAATNAWIAKTNVLRERLEDACEQDVDRCGALAIPSCTSVVRLALLCFRSDPAMASPIPAEQFSFRLPDVTCLDDVLITPC